MADVPSPIDLQDIEDARQWADEVMEKRPYRTDIFRSFSDELRANSAKSILELGSGPAFLSREIVSSLEGVRYTAFDFSEAMHFIAKERLGILSDKVQFVTGSFKENGWNSNFSNFDAVVTLQAIHEVRHKNNVPKVFAEVKEVLKPNGVFLYCDHVCDENGIQHDQLYMTEVEQQSALIRAGFKDITKHLRIGSLALWKAYT